MSKIGRNDPCWCGSGVKYKKCHLDFDRKLSGYRSMQMLKASGKAPKSTSRCSTM